MLDDPKITDPMLTLPDGENRTTAPHLPKLILSQPPAPLLAPHVQLDAFSEPVLDRDFPDPSVLKVGAVYYAFATNSGGINIQVARSEDLLHWEYLGEALPHLPAWASQEFGWTWSPVVTATPEGYLMYLTARYQPGAEPVQAIAVAQSAQPQGPFEPCGTQPLLCQADLGGTIDPAIFTDTDGRRYLLWKNDGNAIDAETWIYIQPVGEDGLTFQEHPARLIKADRPWESKLIEAPALWKHADTYYLFYSGSHFTSSCYAIGYAVSDCIWGPYHKSAQPLLRTDGRRGIVGPGGQDIVIGPDGVTWMLYHGWSLAGHRTMHASRLAWQAIA